MSPTLLELVVALFLLGLAWYIAVRIAPEVITLLITYWRGPKTPRDPTRWPPEKNVTPPDASQPASQRKSDPSRR